MSTTWPAPTVAPRRSTATVRARNAAFAGRPDQGRCRRDPPSVRRSRRKARRGTPRHPRARAARHGGGRPFHDDHRVARREGGLDDGLSIGRDIEDRGTIPPVAVVGQGPDDRLPEAVVVIAVEREPLCRRPTSGVSDRRWVQEVVHVDENRRPIPDRAPASEFANIVFPLPSAPSTPTKRWPGPKPARSSVARDRTKSDTRTPIGGRDKRIALFGTLRTDRRPDVNRR